MHPLFEKRTLAFVAGLLFAAAAAKLLWSVALFIFSPTCPRPPLTTKNIDTTDTIDIGRIFQSGSVGRKAPVTQSLKKMRLKALFKKGDAGFALIEDSGKAFYLDLGKSYRGYRLSEIGRGYILMEKGGKAYKLLLAGTKGKKER